MDKIDLERVELFGSDLRRPEGVMVARDGTVWCAHGGGHCTRIEPDGRGENVGDLGGEPNGICIDRDGNLVIANIGGGCVQRLHPDGRHELITDSMEGEPFTTPNFPFIDTRGRLWVTNSTARVNHETGVAEPADDGVLCIVENGEARVVARGLWFANGVTLDKEEKFVYVAETMKKRVTRFEIGEDGTLGEGEQYGPDFGRRGHPDGIAFDEAGNLWATLPAMNGIGVVDPAGEWHVVVHDPKGTKLPRPTNICFGGDDLRTAYIGNLDGTSLARFEVPHPGMKLVHQMD